MMRIALIVLLAVTATARAEPNFDHISRAYHDAMDRRGLFDRLHDKLGHENAQLLQETWAESQVWNDKLTAARDPASIAEATRTLRNLAETIDHDIEAYEKANAAFSRNATIGTVIGLVAIAGLIVLIVRRRKRR